MSQPNVNDHFLRREPRVRDIYDEVVRVSRTFGPVKEDPKRTSIHLNRKSAFAGVAVRKDGVRLTIKSAEKIDDPRVVKAEQVSANRWHVEVDVTAPKVDARLKRWLRDAYDIAG